MIATLLLTLASAGQDDGLLARTRAILSACDAVTCAPPSPDDQFRVSRDEDGAADAKDRAVAAGRAPCDISARVCTRPPRTLYRAPLVR